MRQRAQIAFLGDSITHGWESRGAKVWAENFASGPYKALNCGISGDRTEHLLWRLQNGQLADLKPKAFIVLKPGYKADLTVIDLKNISVDETKPDARPGGIVHVYVNGKPVLENGEYIGGRNGEVLLKQR